MNEMRCVNMHRPVLLFILGSSQPANPQIPAEEETFRMRTRCGVPCLMLKLKPPNFGHLMEKTDSLEKTLMLGKMEGRRRGRHRG